MRNEIKIRECKIKMRIEKDNMKVAIEERLHHAYAAHLEKYEELQKELDRLKAVNRY